MVRVYLAINQTDMRHFNSYIAAILLFHASAICGLASAYAQTEGHIREILTITGAPSEEDLDEQEIERFQRYLDHPLAINLSSRSRLVSSGLLTRYQAASLEDYRSRNGDVLSFSELAAVEGFGEEYVKALRPFISLYSRSLPGQPAADSLRFRHDLMLRAAFKGKSYYHAGKYKLGVGESAELSWASRSYYQDKRQFPPSAWSANVSVSGKRYLEKLVLGDYNLRIGQGLSLWSGMSLTGFSSSTSFSRRPTGLSASWSWSGAGSHRGAAADFQFGRFSVLPFISFPGLRERVQGSKTTYVRLMPGVVTGWRGPGGQVSMSVWGNQEGGKVSADYGWNLFGTDLFGEVAFDTASGSVAVVTGASAAIGEDWRLSGVARFYPSSYDDEYSGGVRGWTRTSDEKGVALGIERHGASFAADLAVKASDKNRKQLKVNLKAPLQLGMESVLTVRVTERYRPYEPYLKYKTGARIDYDWSSAGLSARYGEGDGDSWKVRARLEGVLCRGMSGLAYMEGGRKTAKGSVYLRGTLFIVDNWDDCIYSYERDAPGNYNVPAYYGRGYSLSAVGGHRLRIKRRDALKVYFRVSTIRYPFMKEPKAPVTEAKIQIVTGF